MGTYTTRVMTTAKPLVFGYRCSKCGNKQLTLKSVLAASAFSYQYSPTTRQENKAADELSDRIVKTYADNVSAINSGNYIDADLECSCHYCKNREPWSFMRNKKLEKVQKTLLILSAVVAVLYIYAVPVPLIAFLIVFLKNKKNIRNREVAIKALPPESLPTVISLKEEALAFLQGNEDSFDTLIINNM